MGMNLIQLTNNKDAMAMKKILYLITSLMLMMTSCDLFEQDNYESFDASIDGAFKDATTGDNVEQECHYVNIYGGNIATPVSGYISAFELGWDYESAIIWLVKYDGSYTNNCIFSGSYRLEAKENNFYPVIKDDVTINKGSNTLDWTVTPYIRIIDPNIIFDSSVGKFKATFKLQYGDNSKANAIYKAMLCCYPDKFVGVHLNNCSGDTEASMVAGVEADGTTVNTLYIDPDNAANETEFKYSPRTHYLRIAVCAVGNGYNSSYHYNYSQPVSIDY
jgi:hypothetical protein